jgi:hypothetical protein
MTGGDDRLALKLGACSVILFVGLCRWEPACADPDFALSVGSSRPDTVTGGDVLVHLGAPNHSEWSARLDGRDVTHSFHPTESAGNLVALLTGLKNGRNVLEIRVKGATKAALDILNHPLAGPIFSGPHQRPFVCQTLASGLGPAQDDNCSANTVVRYYYKSTEPALPLFSREAMLAQLSIKPGDLALGFKTYDPSGPMPSDVAQIVTADGRTVNYIVRREIGTINRAVYDIQFVHDPSQPLPSPWKPSSPGWNGRLVYVFGGGCDAGYRQGTLGIIGRTQEPLLTQGYAVATSTLTMFRNSCNDRISAETLSMVKEHFIKIYGAPVHTIGWGGSGGAMQLYLTAQNYPGLLDGIVAFNSFPDMASTIQTVTDCPLLDRAVANSKPSWTDEQKTAVYGLATFRTCIGWTGGPGVSWPILDPQNNCDPVTPKEAVYDPTANPRGAHCDYYGNEINVFGRDPRTGFAYRPLDNVGVQYGLLAFNAGKINAEQFIELNQQVGGYDEEGRFVAARTEADPDALRIAYQRGLVLTGGGGLSQVPIIDWRQYSDDDANNHDLVRSFMTRARLIAANGSADNQVILVDPRTELLVQVYGNWGDWDAWYVDRERDLVSQMDRWLGNIGADGAPGTLSEKLARDKPTNVADGCRLIDGESIGERATYLGTGGCSQLYPPHADPRIAAGGPLTDDVLKCRLKPIEPTDYSHPLTADQLRRLQAVFPRGVCDYSRPGMGQSITQTTWQRF